MAQSKAIQKESLSEMVNRDLSLKEQIMLTLSLSFPAIMSQLSSILMQYIDAAMVGSLGANATASVGLMAAPVWLFTGICIASCAGYSVQVAHLLGAKQEVEARVVVRQGYTMLELFAVTMAIIACSLSFVLPSFLGGAPEIQADATAYLFVFMAFLPFLQLNYLSSALLRCSGNMLLPSLLNILMCFFDVIFNYIFIFESRIVNLPLLGETFVYGAGLGVTGAALGTGMAALVTGFLMTYAVWFKSNILAITKEVASFLPTKVITRRALRLALPISAQQFMLSSAQIVSTMIVAPLGTASIAAHSLGNTIEAICYMPGIGIADAATTLVGQSLGAKRKDLTKRFATITLSFGCLVMSIMGAIMYISAPWIMSIMTPDAKVQELAVMALRIEAFAEPLFAFAIVGYGICVGAGDTLIPSIMNLSSIWVVRLFMSYCLAQMYGLKGVWIAMAIEICFRGTIFLIRIIFGNWMRGIS